MLRDIEPRKLGIPLRIAKEATSILDKFRDGAIPGKGLEDARDYAMLALLLYRVGWDEKQFNEWTYALAATVRTEDPTLEPLRKKLEQEGHDFIDGAEGDQDSLRDGEALLNLAQSLNIDNSQKL